MKYKVGDKVKIKSIRWYNKNKNGKVNMGILGGTLVPQMTEYLGKYATITRVDAYIPAVHIDIDKGKYCWQEWMFEDKEVKKDAINPEHYKSHPSGVECIQITQHMNFCIGNAIKYLWRAGKKGDAVEDLKKAKWYIDKEIERLNK